MSRIVLPGTPKELYRVTDADLPADRDLRYSYWRYTDFSALCLTGYDMRKMDILDSMGDLCVLPDHDIDGTAATDYIQSRRTSWKGTTIPANLSSLNHDLMKELLYQLSGENLLVKAIADYVGESYLNSWGDALWNARKRAGIPNGKLTAAPGATDKAGLVAKLRAYPRLWYRIERMLSGKEKPQQAPPAARINVLRVRLSDRMEDFDVPVGLLASWADDRYIAEGQLADMMEAQYGESVLVHVAATDPGLQGKAIAARLVSGERWDWWREGL